MSRKIALILGMLLSLLFLQACETNSDSDDKTNADSDDSDRDTDTQTDKCGDYTIDECAQHKDVCLVIAGQKYFADKKCKEEIAGVGCMTALSGCDGAENYLKDLSGETWWFDSGCIPSDWEVFSPGENDPSSEELNSWDVCS